MYTLKNILPKIVVICGPTGSGKTAFATYLADQFNGEIVCADSVQVYRYMDIGTAKPTRNEQRLVFNHMIDIVNPDQDFDVAKYSKLAINVINSIIKRDRNIFVVGGTGFYIRSLIHGLFDSAPSNCVLRNCLKNQVRKYGPKKLHERLLTIDKMSAEKIHPNDTFRVIRALEIFELTGKSISCFQKKHQHKSFFYDVLKIGLKWSRELLYERINERVEKMINIGLIEEVDKLLNSGYLLELKSMSSIGYRHIGEFLFGIRSLDETVFMLKRDHRRYAKRQLTWFNGDCGINWLSFDQIRKAENLLSSFLKN